MLESTVYMWVENVKDLTLALLSGVVPKLPGPIQGILEMFGVQGYLDSKLDKFKTSELKAKQKLEF